MRMTISATSGLSASREMFATYACGRDKSTIKIVTKMYSANTIHQIKTPKR